MPRLGDVVTKAQAVAAFQRTRELADRAATTVRPSRPAEGVPLEYHDELFRRLSDEFVWIDEGWCVGRATLGAAALQEHVPAVTGLPASTYRAAVAVIREPGVFHTAPTVTTPPSQGATVHVMDPALADRPLHLDDWQDVVRDHWPGIPLKRSYIDLESLHRFGKHLSSHDGLTSPKSISAFFALGVRSTWAQAAQRGRVTEDLAAVVRRSSRDVYEARRTRAPDTAHVADLERTWTAAMAVQP